MFWDAMGALMAGLYHNILWIDEPFAAISGENTVADQSAMKRSISGISAPPKG